MPEHASRFAASLYDQQNEDQVADWGGDDLFTRMPRPRAVDDAPAPRFRPSLMLVDQPQERRQAPAGGAWERAHERRRQLTAEEAMRERAERLGLALVDEDERGAALRRDDAAHGEEAGYGAAAGRQASAPAAAVPGWDPAVWEAATSATVRQWDGEYAAEERAPNGRRTKLITGRPDSSPRPRPLALTPAERRRPARTPAEWVGPRPERIMAWAFVLGLLLILIAISTADAAAL